MPRSAAGTATISRHTIPIMRFAVCAGLWSMVKETRWRFREGYDPYVKPGEGVRFYGKPDGKANDHRRSLRAACGNLRMTNMTFGW